MNNKQQSSLPDPASIHQQIIERDSCSAPCSPHLPAMTTATCYQSSRSSCQPRYHGHPSQASSHNRKLSPHISRRTKKQLCPTNPPPNPSLPLSPPLREMLPNTLMVLRRLGKPLGLLIHQPLRQDRHRTAGVVERVEGYKPQGVRVELVTVGDVR